jgi:hypothetical protein
MSVAKSEKPLICFVASNPSLLVLSRNLPIRDEKAAETRSCGFGHSGPTPWLGSAPGDGPQRTEIRQWVGEDMARMTKILLADDSKFLRLATERALARAGYEVSTATDGEHALQIARENSRM